MMATGLPGTALTPDTGLITDIILFNSPEGNMTRRPNLVVGG